MQGVEPPVPSDVTAVPASADDPAYERCHEVPILRTEAHARGIIGIHERLGCTFDTCDRLRAARLYLATFS
ncbi:hypothetical protein IU421_28115 [Nocardia cyriacigeorgica]|uniref:hypothetical protein n=1 Tax=Nocardia cyriacigeorgica TaxID=135487 RepID=UPI00189444E4|nr:hypothetical protein [Nocardia cyriacigeorgica]MBF6162078.1 hypothetical protein [Nocardia cyriacigeorgica]MBF6200860.1 hypothetical protein [Nocardia cyriacigeorgica]MBF6320492.1 hypothetical protein [Nocardia cyriacigeorgica]MBF6346271.1 hypothetical protein [Nocardia cyriacigeorgica]MBF6518119.1 hypothetical protein [Nocardia cyriacigeorgica]